MSRREHQRLIAYLESVRGHVFKNGCFDCIANATVALDDDGIYRLDVFHQPTCPAVAGMVPYRAGAVIR